MGLHNPKRWTPAKFLSTRRKQNTQQGAANPTPAHQDMSEEFKRTNVTNLRRPTEVSNLEHVEICSKIIEFYLL